MEHYLRSYAEFSDIQDSRPQPLEELELSSTMPRVGQ
jgi:hypothetical protein